MVISEDLIDTNPTEGSAGAPSGGCQIAQRYHTYLKSVRALSDSLRALMSEQIGAYDLYYENLAKLDAKTVAEVWPEETKIVIDIEKKSAEFGVARDQIPDVFLATCIDKMKDLARAATQMGRPAGLAWTDALATFRGWRIEHMDGRDVDMSLLLQERTANGSPDGLFAHLFRAWSKEAFPRHKPSVVRASILEELGLPDLAIRPGRMVEIQRQFGFPARP